MQVNTDSSQRGYSFPLYICEDDRAHGSILELFLNKKRDVAMQFDKRMWLLLLKQTSPVREVSNGMYMGRTEQRKQNQSIE